MHYPLCKPFKLRSLSLLKVRLSALKALENYKNDVPKQRIVKPKIGPPAPKGGQKTATQRFGPVQSIPVQGNKHPSVEWSVHGHHQRPNHKELTDPWKSEYCSQYPTYPTTVYTRSVSTLTNFSRPLSTQANIGRCGPVQKTGQRCFESRK